MDRIFSRSPELQEFQKKNDGCMFEALVVLAAWEVSGSLEEAIDSPLLRRYQERVQDGAGDPTTRKHAERVLARFNVSSGGRASLAYGGYSGALGRFGFKHSVDRLELLSPGLIGERESPASLRP